MSTKLFVVGPDKTGGRMWDQSGLAPQRGIPDQVEGFRMYQAGNFPAVVDCGETADRVYGELFPGVLWMTVGALDKAYRVPDLYKRIEVRTVRGNTAWMYVSPTVPGDAKLIPDGTWRTLDITRGLWRLANEMVVDLGERASTHDRKALAITIREEVRPLVQANWVGIEWRTSPTKSEWQLCREWMDRLAFAVEIGL